MRNIMIFAAVIAGLGTFMAQMADRMTPALANTVARSAAPVEMAVVESNSGRRSLSIPHDARGHFATEGRIEGQRINFMVDTGASMIALTARDAASLGIHPSEREFTAAVKTANGIARAAPVTLNMVEIDDIMVRNVAAMVMPDGALSDNLLGLSFLQKLHRFEYADGRLVLEQ